MVKQRVKQIAVDEAFFFLFLAPSLVRPKAVADPAGAGEAFSIYDHFLFIVIGGRLGAIATRRVGTTQFGIADDMSIARVGMDASAHASPRRSLFF